MTPTASEPKVRRRSPGAHRRAVAKTVAGTTVAVVLVDETLVVGTAIREASDTSRSVEGPAACDGSDERPGVTDASTAVMAKSTASSPAARSAPCGRQGWHDLTGPRSA